MPSRTPLSHLIEIFVFPRLPVLNLPCIYKYTNIYSLYQSDIFLLFLTEKSPTPLFLSLSHGFSLIFSITFITFLNHEIICVVFFLICSSVLYSKMKPHKSRDCLFYLPAWKHFFFLAQFLVHVSCSINICPTMQCLPHSWLNPFLADYRWRVNDQNLLKIIATYGSNPPLIFPFSLSIVTGTLDFIPRTPITQVCIPEACFPSYSADSKEKPSSLRHCSSLILELL